jgi:hypothetical protein
MLGKEYVCWQEPRAWVTVKFEPEARFGMRACLDAEIVELHLSCFSEVGHLFVRVPFDLQGLCL